MHSEYVCVEEEGCAGAFKYYAVGKERKRSSAHCAEQGSKGRRERAFIY